MHKMFKMLVIATAASVATLSAQTVNVGSPNSVQPSCFPFGCPVAHNQFEQIYASSLFASPIDISSISFYNSVGGGTFGGSTYSIYLSETSASPASPSGTPANNITGPETLFATFSSPGGTPGPVFTLTGTGFSYDPTLGNLLLDIRYTPAGVNITQAHFDVVKSSSVSVITDESVFLGDDDTKGAGFVTTFAAASAPTTVTPEPDTMALMAIGLIGMGMPLLRGRRKRTA